MKSLALIAALFAPTLAVAQNNCASTDEVRELLSGRFGEQPVASGMFNQNGTSLLVELWGNTDSGSWTYVVTGPNAISCIMSSGGNFEALPALVGEPA